MNDLEILVPILPDHDAHLRHCLGGIVDNTPIRSYSVIGLASGGDVPPPFRASTAPWTVMDFGDATPAQAVLEGIQRAQGVYVVVVPPTHAIADQGWFGKLQLPFLRVPSCGMVVADEIAVAHSGAGPYQVMPRGGMPGQIIMAPRQTLAAIARAADKNNESYAEALLYAATSLGLATWAVPGVRVDISKPAAEGVGEKPSDARSAG